MACAPSKDTDQPGHLSSLIRVFTVCMKKAWVLSYPLSAQQRLRSAWADAQADLSLRWAHMPFCRFCHALARIYYEGSDQDTHLHHLIKTFFVHLKGLHILGSFSDILYKGDKWYHFLFAFLHGSTLITNVASITVIFRSGDDWYLPFSLALISSVK